VYLAALSLRTAVHAGVDAQFAPLQFDLTLRLAERHAFDSVEAAVARVPGVTGAEAWNAARAGVARDDGTLGNTFPITGLPAASRMFAAAVTRGRWLAEDDRLALVVNRGLLDDEPSLAVGAEVTLMVAGRPVRWTVVGMIETVPTPAAYVPREVLADLMGSPGADVVVVDAAIAGDGAELDLIGRLRADLGRDGFTVNRSVRLAESRRVMEDHHLMVADFLGVMAWLMILVGGLGLASTMSLAVLERTREIGVLRAIGARHRSILAIVQVEALVIGLLSWGLAIPLSLPMRAVLGEVYSRIILRVPLEPLPDARALLVWLGVVLGVSLAASAWPAFRAMRVPTAAALAYE
jgi:putative ABC transport system permease protein